MASISTLPVKFKTIFIGGFISLLSQYSYAILPIDTTSDPELGWSGLISASLSGATGNSKSQESELDWIVRYRKEEHIILLLSNFNHEETFDTTTTDEFSIHFRHIQLQKFGAALDSELFTQWSYNELQDLRSRRLLGAGARWRVFQSSTQNWRSDKNNHDSTLNPRRVSGHIGFGGFHEIETRDSFEETTRVNRLNLYAMLIWKNPLQEHPFTAWARFYVQPSIDTPSDVRAIASSGLSFPLYKRLELAISTDLSHDSKPYGLVKKNRP